MRKLILLLIFCTFTILELSAAWNIVGTLTVYPYRPYRYFAGNATGISETLKSNDLYFTWKVTNGKIMDKSGNYTLTSLEINYGDNQEISVMWDFASRGELSVCDKYDRILFRTSIYIGSGYLTVSGTYSGYASFDKAYVTMQNANFQNGSN